MRADTGLQQVNHQTYGKCYKLVHQQDIALSAIMQGAIVNQTILPSGTKTPAQDLIAKGIYLCQQKPKTDEKSQKGKKVYRILARTQWSNKPSDSDQFIQAENEQEARQKFKPMGTLKVIHSVTLTNLESADQLKAYRMEIALGAKKLREEIMFGVDAPAISKSIWANQKLHGSAIQYFGPVVRNL